MRLLPTRRQRALFWEKAPLAVFGALVILPGAVVLGAVLLAILATIAGLPGAQLAADSLVNALVLVALLQGNVVFAVLLFATLCFIGSLWRLRLALWCSGADLFSKTTDLMRLWRAMWTHAPTAPRLSPTRSVECKQLVPVRQLSGAFTPGLTPQL